jgi:eukaryotic-like serine/threonine-protein kinase
MQPREQWARVSTLFHAATPLPPHDRRAYLMQASGGEQAIVEEVESLLAAHEAVGTFLEEDEPRTAEERGPGAWPIVPPGTRLGAFEIFSWIGAGGMGQVYRARDTRLDRLVALKLLAPDLHADPRLLARFEQEARALSRLTHPHVCVLLDVGQGALPDGTTQPFLVMELVEGETLAACLARGRLPLEQALEYGIQIAAALAAAHAQGIVHRDLKPANIMLTKAGVKLLDFGLAGIRSPGAERARLRAWALDDAPVGTEPLAGTLPYMAPEQIRGDRTDARTDLFAFGAVLYEMLSGARAFAADSRAALAEMILTRDPPPLPATDPPVPPAVTRLVRTCLAKAPDNRWQDAQHVALVLRVVAEQVRDRDVTAPPAPPRTSWAKPSAAAWLLAAAALAGVFFLPTLGRAPAVTTSDGVPYRLMFDAPPVPGGQAWSPHVSPDGRIVAFIGTPSGKGDTFFIRRLDSGEVRPLTASRDIAAGCWGADWSADSRTLLYFSGGLLRAIDVGSGTHTTLALSAAPRSTMHAGVATSRDGTVLVGGPWLQRWSLGEAALSDVYPARDDVRLQVWPSFLPGGREFLFAQYASDPTHQGIYLGSLDSPEVVRVLPVFSNAALASSGHLVFGRNGSILAQPFDRSRRAVTGEPLVIAAGVASDNGYTHFGLGPRDTLVYVPPDQMPGELVWYDRRGDTAGTLGRAADYRQFVMSPDGRRLAIESQKTSPDGPRIEILDLTRAAATVDQRSAAAGERVFFERGVDPVWAPDSRRIAFTRVSDSEINLFVSSPDPSEPPVRVADLPGMQWAEQWTADGRILYVQSDSATRVSIWSVALDGDRTPVALVTLPHAHDEPQLSPNGRWLAYVSNQSGRAEVYVQPPDNLSRRWQLSEGGGGQPKWRADGRELFHITLDGTLMVSAVGPDGPGAARPLFRVPLTPEPGLDQYAVTPDGQRFLVLTPVPDGSAARFTVLGNWPALLRGEPNR